MESDADKLEKYLTWLEKLLSISEGFFADMSRADQKEWKEISAAVADERAA